MFYELEESEGPLKGSSSDSASDADASYAYTQTHEVEVLALESKLKELQEVKSQHESKIALWEGKRKSVEIEMKQTDQGISDLNKKIMQLKNEGQPSDEELRILEAPGPECLRWIESMWFSLLSGLVVVTNIVYMVVTAVWSLNAPTRTKASIGFLAFYTVELSLKAIFWRGMLLCGPCRFVWANWLDTIIVASAFVEQVLLPDTAGNLGVLRVFRLFRLVRICKLIASYARMDPAWVEGDKFTTFILGVIFVNCITMGVGYDNPTWFIWPYVENIYLSIFFLELSVRLRFHGCKDFFFGEHVAFNWLDFVVVTGGVLDLWLMPVYSFLTCALGDSENCNGGGSTLKAVVNILRMMRLFRLLRIIRLARNVQPLWELLVGIVLAFQGMIWIGLLTFGLLYLITLVLLSLYGRNGLLLSDNDSYNPDDAFSGVLMSMWILFMAMNGDPGGFQPLFDSHPWTYAIAVIYMVFTGFAILSILTGVVCDKMAVAAEEHQKELDDKEAKDRDGHARVVLEATFSKVSSGHGEIYQDEFKRLLADEALCAEICEATGFETDDLEKLWTSLSSSEHKDPMARNEPSISHDDFIAGVLTAKQPVCELSILRLERRITYMEQRIRQP
jgi:hypothetical protein